MAKDGGTIPKTVVSHHTVKDLNPRSQAVKSLETTVLRCLQLIEEFDKLQAGDDWMGVPMAKYRTILGNDHYNHRNMIAEVFKRYQGATLYKEVLDLFENLPPAAQKRKEIADGIRGVRKAIDSGSEGKPARAPTRRGH